MPVEPRFLRPSPQTDLIDIETYRYPHDQDEHFRLYAADDPRYARHARSHAGRQILICDVFFLHGPLLTRAEITDRIVSEYQMAKNRNQVLHRMYPDPDHPPFPWQIGHQFDDGDDGPIGNYRKMLELINTRTILIRDAAFR